MKGDQEKYEIKQDVVDSRWAQMRLENYLFREQERARDLARQDFERKTIDRASSTAALIGSLSIIV